MRRSGVYIVNEPKQEDSQALTTGNGSPDHVFLNKMDGEDVNDVLNEDEETTTLPVVESTSKKKEKKTRLPSVYRYVVRLLSVYRSLDYRQCLGVSLEYRQCTCVS